MTTELVRRVKRLISYRKIGRDKAGVDVSMSKAKRDRVENEVNAAKQTVKDEQTEVANHTKESFEADDMQLSICCLKAAVDDAATKKEQLDKAESEVNEKTHRLLAAHRQVKQMDALQETIQKQRDQKIRSKEQREIDDLATTREAMR